MNITQRFHFLRAIGDYLERHVEGIDLSVVTSYDDGTGTITLYWYTNDEQTEVEIMSYRIDLTGQIVGLPLSLEDWLMVPPAIRAFVRAFNHMSYQTLAAAGYADGLIEREGVKHG